MRFTFSLGLIWLAAAASGGDPPGGAATDPDRRTDLLARVKSDQDARTALTDWLKKNGEGDRPPYGQGRQAGHTAHGLAWSIVTQPRERGG